MRSMILALVALLGCSMTTLAAEPATRPEPTPREALANAKLGFFVHYVYTLTAAAPGKPPLTNLDQFANDLDVNTIANLAQAMGAQYVILTSYHFRITTLYPSKVWGGIFPDHACKRDIIGDLAAALKARHIRFVLYVHPDDRHDLPAAMLKKLADAGFSSPSYGGGEPADPKWDVLYEKMLEEIGQRYGSEISGYWEDDGGGGTDGKAVQKIMEKYTPGAAIWLNGGATNPPDNLIGGESQATPDNNPAARIQNTTTAQTDNIVCGNWWADNSQIKYSPETMYRFLICTIATTGQTNGGVVYAAGPYSNNQWETGVADGLTKLGKYVKASAAAIYDTVPSKAYVSGREAGQKPSWGVAVDSMDGKTVFLHVLAPPAGNVLKIARPANGEVFDKAALLNGASITLQSNDGGYALTLPAGTHWDNLDTVVALNVLK